MRIIAGKFKGRKLGTVSDSSLRPAMGKTREALFSMLYARGMCFDGASVLDIFAGCGSLAFEALSRGAGRACLVENAARQCACIRRNMESLGVGGRCRVFQQDALSFMRRAAACAFDLVFLDPPYRRDLAGRVLGMLSRGCWLNDGAFVVAETEKGVNFAIPDNLSLEHERLFGQTCVSIWKYL